LSPSRRRETVVAGPKNHFGPCVLFVRMHPTAD
jgi:hypothetical protein